MCAAVAVPGPDAVCAAVAVPGPTDPSNTSYMLKGEIFNLVNTMGELVLFSGIAAAVRIYRMAQAVCAGEGTPHRSSSLTEQQVDWLSNEQVSQLLESVSHASEGVLEEGMDEVLLLCRWTGSEGTVCEV